MEQSNQWRKIWNVVSSVMVSIIVILAIALAGIRLFGIQVYSVLSGSMEPTYPTGALLYVKKVDYKTLRPGDVITFMLAEDTVATHRIVEVIPDESDPSVVRYRTKGDANEIEDGGSVHCKNIIGTPVLSIPYLGYVANYIQTPPGLYIAVSSGAILLLLVFLPDLFRSKDNMEKKKRKSKESPEET